MRVQGFDLSITCPFTNIALIEISLNNDNYQYLRSIIINTRSIFAAEEIVSNEITKNQKAKKNEKITS